MTDKKEINKTFLVYGHDSKGNGVLLEVKAKNGAEALETAREQRPNCRFNHTNIK